MKQKSSLPNPLITKFMLLLVVMLILTLYFWGHNIEQSRLNLAHGLVTITRAGIHVGTVAVLVSIAGGIGRRVLGRMALRPNELSHAEKVALEAGIGLGIVSIGGLLLGLLGLYNSILWVVLVLVGIVNFMATLDWFNTCRRVLSRAFTVETAWQRFILIFTSALLIAALFIALAPPFAYDALTYHLEGAQRYVQAGRIAAQPDNFFLGFPQGVEVLYGLLMLPFGSDHTPALLHFTFGLLGLMATAGLTRRYSDANTAYSSVLLVMSSYSIWLLFGYPYVDLALFCYSALTLIAITQWNKEKATYWLVLCGVLAGMALGVKYTAASLIIALSVFILIRQPRQVMRHGLIFGLSLFVAFLPWLVKGMLLYQNPVYPYVFGGLNWDGLRGANFSSAGHGLLSGNLWWNLPMLPFAATFFGIEQYSPYSFTTGAWLLTLPFSLGFGWKALDPDARSLARDLLPMALVMLVFWMVLAATSGIGAQPRLMLVGLPVVAILAAFGLRSIARLPRKPLDVYFIVQGVLIFSLLIGLFDIIHNFAETRVLDYTAGTISGDEYLRDNIGVYYAVTQELTTLPENSTVLFLFQPGSYYCPGTITCIPDVLFDNWSRPLLQGTTPAELMQQWRVAGVDYVLLFDSGISPDESDKFGYEFWLEQHENAYNANMLLPETIAEYFAPLWDDGFAYRLYEWIEPNDEAKEN
jgi:Dolichyl-phosphate-mannose-protein mannosyltransferase